MDTNTSKDWKFILFRAVLFCSSHISLFRMYSHKTLYIDIVKWFLAVGLPQTLAPSKIHLLNYILNQFSCNDWLIIARAT